MLFNEGVEGWRRGWRQYGGMPTREAVVAASDLTRGAAATTQIAPDGRLAYTVLGAPVGTDRVLSSVGDHLSGTDASDVHLIVDDIAPVLANRGAAAVEAFICRLRNQFPDSIGTVTIGCSIDAETDPEFASIFDLVDTVTGSEPIIGENIGKLRRDDPTTFGYVRRHWAEAQRGIEACNRNYPQSKQIHAMLSEPETTPRTLGATLSGLVTLDVLETWSETVGPTRYDLTAYRAKRLWEVGIYFARLASSRGLEHTEGE
ncbi:hypothetical protein C461_06849 [Halorubrum aidingense JCM 13560]|uniref:Uncharacterized protein n=1 Tax=Halorubrum aidingense JCM 13560 TaxID=1230454 RepID=M0PHM0_9EURY|nr:hypothetical protein C461_06849 [Halorubrum aidingense JCM 13560]